MKSKRTKYILLTCGVLLVIVVICLVLVAISGIGISLLWPFSRATAPTTAATAVTETVIEPNTESVTEQGTETTVPPAESNFPSELMSSVTQIESQVSQIRGLNATEPFDRELISETDLEQIVKDDFFADYTDDDARKDVIELSTLGLLPAGFNLKQLYTDLYSEQIAGFYDAGGTQESNWVQVAVEYDFPFTMPIIQEFFPGGTLHLVVKDIHTILAPECNP